MQKFKEANIQILIVEDEVIAEATKDCLESLRYSVPDVVNSGEEAIRKVIEICPDLVLMDISLKGNIDGVQATEKIWNLLQISVIYTTGHSDRSTVQRAKITGAFGYILKPFGEKDLYVTIETALQKHKVEIQLKREQWLDTILRSVGDAVIVTDINSCVKFLNPVAEALTGWKQEDALDRNLQEVFNIINEETHTPAKNLVALALES